MRAIDVQAAVKRFRSSVALGGVSLALEEGYVLGLVGPNGAGKTTLLKSILNLVRLDAGSIEVFGCRHDSASVRAEIGFVHELDYLFENLTATETELIARAAYPTWNHATFVSYLRRFELPTRRRIKEFSKGMRTRLSLALALFGLLFGIDAIGWSSRPIGGLDLLRVAAGMLLLSVLIPLYLRFGAATVRIVLVGGMVLLVIGQIIGMVVLALSGDGGQIVLFDIIFAWLQNGDPIRRNSVLVAIGALLCTLSYLFARVVYERKDL